MRHQHVHFAVDDLAAGVRFYSTMFAREPEVLKSDYAKWVLDDSRVNFAISLRGVRPSGSSSLDRNGHSAPTL